MSFKRRVLSALGKDVLLEIGRGLELDVTSRMSVEELRDIDPSLPLDNLDIVCADALFTDWPEVDAIVGDPPMLGDRKLRSELGADYLAKLQAATGVDGVVDLSCYWFRRAHDRLHVKGRAGLVGTSGLTDGIEPPPVES